jgi:non-ribosomal peptide synthetase component F
VVVGTPIAGRTRAETEKLIGFFVNTLALTATVRGEMSWRELLQQVREVSLGAHAHQDVPFERLVEELRPERSLSQQPLVQVMFALQNATGGGMTELELEGLRLSPFGWQAEEAEAGQTAKFDLSLSLAEVGDEVVGSLTYATDLFAEETIRRLAQHYMSLVEVQCARPEEAVGGVQLLSAGEREQLASWRETKDYAEELSVVEQFARQAEARPAAVALECAGERLSYGELQARVAVLAEQLRELGVGEGAVVGLMLERSFEAVASVLAVWETGAAFLPLEPSYPVERLRYMVADAGVELLLVAEGETAEWHEGRLL